MEIHTSEGKHRSGLLGLKGMHMIRVPDFYKEIKTEWQAFWTQMRVMFFFLWRALLELLL